MLMEYQSLVFRNMLLPREYSLCYFIVNNPWGCKNFLRDFNDDVLKVSKNKIFRYFHKYLLKDLLLNIKASVSYDRDFIFCLIPRYVSLELCMSQGQ